MSILIYENAELLVRGGGWGQCGRPVVELCLAERYTVLNRDEVNSLSLALSRWLAAAP